MKRIIIAATTALALAGAADPKPGGVRLSATLTGAAGVGDPDGTGAFAGRLSADRTQLCYTLTWDKLADVKMAHIHTGAAGTNGGVFVNLPDLTPGEHCTAVTLEQAAALTANPAGYYVNVHTASHMAGAIRGQLAKN